MSFDIRFGTYNVGQGFADYKPMLEATLGCECDEIQSFYANANQQVEAFKGRHTAEELTQLTADKINDMAVMTSVERSVAERLSDSCDVIALQEVMDENRTFIRTLVGRGFKIYKLENPADGIFSTAVAVRSECFEEEVVNTSIASKTQGARWKPYGRDIAGVVVKVKGGAATLAFSSLHTHGFQLCNAKTNPASVRGTEPQKAKAMAYAAEGIENLGRQKVDYAVLAADMNSNPHNHKEQYDQIQRAGFEILEPNEPTNINGYEVDYTHRKIDFIFASDFAPKLRGIVRRVLSVVSLFFISKLRISVSPAQVLSGFDFAPGKNCSDHKPVVSVISITTKSVFWRMGNYLLGCFRKGDDKV